MPHTRMLGVSFDSEGIPKFHTSPTSIKVEDINLSSKASLTFAFQRTLGSISLEGLLEPLSSKELERDWQKLDQDFQRNYFVFGHQSGRKIDFLAELRTEQDRLPNYREKDRPSSFIGYSFKTIDRITFYTVAEKDFALCELYERDLDTRSWIYSLRVP